jgi:hypothetical protein
MPSRATATQLYCHHLGGVDKAWGGLFHPDPADPIRMEIIRGNEALRGRIISDLPTTITNWLVIWVQNDRTTPRVYATDDAGKEAYWVKQTSSGKLLNVGRMGSPSALAPGDSYDLSEVDVASMGLENNIQQRWVSDFAKQDPFGTGTIQFRPDEQRKRLEAIGLYRMLTPPQYLRHPGAQSTKEEVALTRELGRELDLSTWLTRPCIIVIAFAEDTACPVPLRRDGKPVTSNGRTIVRWIYPLPLERAVAFDHATAEEVPDSTAP